MHKIFVPALVLLTLVAPAAAFEVSIPPVTTASPGYLFPNDQYQRDRWQQNADARPAPATPPAGHGEIQLDAAAQARVQAAVAALVPEYNARLARDGETAANDWIRQKAFELGQREADLLKAQMGR